METMNQIATKASTTNPAMGPPTSPGASSTPANTNEQLVVGSSAQRTAARTGIQEVGECARKQQTPSQRAALVEQGRVHRQGDAQEER